MTVRLILLRHPEVAARWRGRCYGQTDVGLSRAGIMAARELAETLIRKRNVTASDGSWGRGALPPPSWPGLSRPSTTTSAARSQVVDGRDKPGQDGTKIKQPPVTSSINAVFASSLRRARLPAEYIAAALGLPLRLDARLAERCFGTWEGRCWDEIWAETGSAMDGMINAPSAYRPGGGETTTELAERVLDWFHSLPAGTAAVAVSHGGPIAALAGRLCNEPVRDWLRFVPACGEGLLIVPAADEWEVATWQPAPWNVFSDG